MADVHRFSEQVIDLAERLANVADAAQGRDNRRGRPKARWLLLPAAGAGLYALATSGAFTRQAKEAVGEAKARVSSLPDELVGRVQEATGTTSSGSSRHQTTRKTTRRTGGQRRAKAGSKR